MAQYLKFEAFLKEMGFKKHIKTLQGEYIQDDDATLSSMGNIFIHWIKGDKTVIVGLTDGPKVTIHHPSIKIWRKGLWHYTDGDGYSYEDSADQSDVSLILEEAPDECIYQSMFGGCVFINMEDLKNRVFTKNKPVGSDMSTVILLHRGDYDLSYNDPKNRPSYKEAKVLTNTMTTELLEKATSWQIFFVDINLAPRERYLNRPMKKETK